jgi:DNA-binding transcriptional ArsR family regulator
MAIERRPATEAEAKALASAIRLRILRVCLDEPLTNKEIADRLDSNPATTLHHVRRLVATGFLAPQQARRGPRGSREIPYLATGKSWTLNVGGDPKGHHAMVETLLAELRLVEDWRRIRNARLGLRLTDDEHAELSRRMQELFDELQRRPASPGARPYSIFYWLYPDESRAVTPPASSGSSDPPAGSPSPR